MGCMRRKIALVRAYLDKFDIRLYFLIVGAVFGVLIVFITPPVAGFDEEQHFYRAYQVSDMKFKPEKVSAVNVYGEPGVGYGGYLPKSVFNVINKLRNSMNEDKSYQYGQIKRSIKTKLNAQDKVAVRFDNTAIYSPMLYAPQAVGINIGKIFNLSPTILSYLGRLANLSFWLALIYFAIKLTPVGRWAFVILALNPASIFLASSLSPDAVCIAVVALFLAIIMKLTNGKDRISTFDYLLVLIATVATALLKNVYIPIIFLLFLIPSKAISVKRKIFTIILGCLVGLAWNYLILKIANGIPTYFSIDLHISTYEQIMLMITEPFRFLSVLIWNIFGMPSVVLSAEISGSVSDTALPFWSTLLWFFILAISLLKNERHTKITNRWIYIVIACLTGLAIIFSLYIGWNEVGAVRMIGIQARYFLPVGFLLVPILIGRYDIFSKKFSDNFDIMAKIAMIIILMSTVLTLIVRYAHGIS